MRKLFIGVYYGLALVYSILTLLLFFGIMEPDYELQETIYSLKWFVFWAIARTYVNEK